MAGHTDQLTHVTLLPETLWAPGQRSRELTPLYVQRYAGPRLSSHMFSHPFVELTICFDGRGELISESRATLRRGSAAIIPAHTAHRERSAHGMDTLWIGLRGTMTDALTPPDITATESEALLPLAESLWQTSQAARPLAGPACDGAARQLLARLLEAHHIQSSDEADLVGRAISFMHDALSRPLTVAMIAAELGCSEGHLHRRFRRQTGHTPRQRLTELRMDRAIRLMQQTSLNIKQIAQRVGYPDPLHFSRAFRRHFGYPPTGASRRLPPSP